MEKSLSQHKNISIDIRALINPSSVNNYSETHILAESIQVQNVIF